MLINIGTNWNVCSACTIHKKKAGFFVLFTFLWDFGCCAHTVGACMPYCSFSLWPHFQFCELMSNFSDCYYDYFKNLSGNFCVALDLSQRWWNLDKRFFILLMIRVLLHLLMPSVTVHNECPLRFLTLTNMKIFFLP